VVWTPNKSHTLWAAVSRAVRTPTRVESDLFYRVAQTSLAPPVFILFIGNPNLKSEVLHAYELGYRYGWKQKLTLDVTLYYNGYHQLSGQGAPDAPVIHPDPFYIDVPVPFANVSAGQTHGLELSLKYAPVHRWTVSTGITELRGSTPSGIAVAPATNDPRQQVNMQSQLDLTKHLNFDAAYYYYDAIPHQLPPVNRVDVGASTKPFHGFTFSVWARNLQADRHFEATPYILPAGEIRRSVVFKLLWESNENYAKGKP